MLSGTVKITNKIIITCEQGDKRKMSDETFVRSIVYCNNCKNYVMPYGSNGFLWCPKCGVDNRNIEVSNVFVHNMGEQRNITEKLKEANKKGVKIVL